MLKIPKLEETSASIERLGEALASEHSFEQAIADEAARLFGSSLALFFVPVGGELPEIDHFAVAAAAGDVVPEMLEIKLPAKGSETGDAFMSGKPRWVADLAGPNSDSAPESSETGRRFGYRSGVLAPVAELGVLVIGGRESGIFDAEHVEHLSAFTGCAAAIWQAFDAGATKSRTELIYELHDGPLQVMSAALMEAELDSQGDEKVGIEVVETLADAIRTAVGRIRVILTSNAAEDRSLFESLVAIPGALHAGQVEVSTKGADISSASPFVGELARIAVEAVSNAIRHSGSGDVRLLATVSEAAVEIEVTDYGSGFDVDGVPRGFGVASMADRAARLGGQLIIESQLGRGTTVRVSVPRSGLQVA